MTRRARRWPPLLLAVLVVAALLACFPALAGAAPRLVSGGHQVGRAASGDAAARPAVGIVTEDDADRYHADYVIHQDGSVDVTQEITWVFPSGEERHGILRTVTVRAGWKDSTEQYRYYELSEVSVTSPTGAPTDLTINDFGATKQLRIGSPSETVTGTQTYIVKFRLAHVMNDIGDGTAEFYYNHLSTSNSYAYRQVSASVTAPAAATKAACFYGPQGSTTQCTAAPGATTTFTIPDLGPEEGASILASYPRAAFGDLTPDLRQGAADAEGAQVLSPRVARLVGLFGYGLGAFIPLLAAGLMGVLVWTRGRDERYAGLTPGLTPGMGQQVPVVRSARAPTVAVQFTPPEGVQPGMVGTVIDESANVVDVTATLIDLAVRGYLTLTAPDKRSMWHRNDWTLTRTNPPVGATPLNSYEQTLYDGVFATGSVVRLSELKNRFAPTLNTVQRLMYDEVVHRGWFRRSPQKQRQGFFWVSAVLMALSVGTVFFGPGATSGVFDDARLPVNPVFILGAGGFVAGLIVFLLGQRMAARTALGSAVLAQSKGFEQYLRTADANQIRWEEAQEIFSRYLPYAIVFGIAERWAQVFEEVAKAAVAAGHTVLMPTWYVGGWDGNTFENIAADMDSFSTQAAGTFASTPGSSGSSGFSSGGGFSGGGGGGSGGGSW